MHPTTPSTREARRTAAMTEAVLPPPTGPHAIGRCSFDIVDDRLDPYARRRGVRRTLPVTVWYPADPDDISSPSSRYLPGWWRPVSWMWGLDARRVRTHSRESARPSDAGPFPLLVLSPSANPAHAHTALGEELASHGYVVAGISHPYESMPWTAFAHRAPRVVRLRSLGGALSTPGSRPYEVDMAERAGVVAVKADDIAAVATALRRGSSGPPLPVDPGAWGVIGHSFGGGAAVELATRGTVAAAVSLDGGLWRPADTAAVTVPVLQLFAEHPELVDPIPDVMARKAYADPAYASTDRATSIAAWQTVHTSSPDGHTAVISRATHTSISDWPLLAIRSWSPARRALGGVAGQDVHDAVTAAVRPFLHRHLRHAPIDVDDALHAVPGLRVGEPIALFAGVRPSCHDANDGRRAHLTTDACDHSPATRSHASA